MIIVKASANAETNISKVRIVKRNGNLFLCLVSRRSPKDGCDCDQVVCVAFTLGIQRHSCDTLRLDGFEQVRFDEVSDFVADAAVLVQRFLFAGCFFG